MNRVTILLDDDMLAILEAAVKECGCGSKSAHIRHLIKAERKEN
jgi:metal-responsive CopG/Arc/MetJ family transcriptional regulator